MTKDEAMKLALEALKNFEKAGLATLKTIDAITALKQALEQLEPEPVAVVSGYFGGKCVVLPTDPARIFNSGTAFYTHPPKRTWQGLTDNERMELAVKTGAMSADWLPFMEAVEKKLKEKNEERI